jgi:inosose dehydratase
MTQLAPVAPDLRRTLRRPGDALPGASIGTVPILWNNVDIVELRLGTDAATLLDEIARTGYEGTQHGLGFPPGDELRPALAGRGLRLAEVYASISATVDGPTDAAAAEARERLDILVDGDGEVLCVALDGSADRGRTAGRASGPGTPVLTGAGWRRLADLLHDLGRATRDAGRRMAFHPHAGTYVETPEEVERLTELTDPELVPLCLDVGHYTVGRGDPVEALRTYGERVTHVHLKDVSAEVLAGLRDGSVAGFGDAIRARLFTELGAGVLDLDGLLGVLIERGYSGWLMVEQDSCWGPPSESAAIGRRVLGAALRRLGQTPEAGSSAGAATAAAASSAEVAR